MAHVLGAWSLLLHAVPCLATSTPPCGGSQSPYSPQHLELHTLPDLPLPISTLHIENKDPPPGRQPSCLDKGREAYVPLLPSVPAGELGMNIGRVRVTCASLWGISVQGKMVAGSTIVQLGRLATISPHLWSWFCVCSSTELTLPCRLPICPQIEEIDIPLSFSQLPHFHFALGLKIM